MKYSVTIETTKLFVLYRALKHGFISWENRTKIVKNFDEILDVFTDLEGEEDAIELFKDLALLVNDRITKEYKRDHINDPNFINSRNTLSKL